MTPPDLVEELHRRGVQLWAEGDRLCFRAPQGTLTPELRQAVRRHKAEVLEAVAAAEVELPSLVPDPGSRLDPFPLTDLQEAYWLGSRQGLELGGVSPHAYVEYDLPSVDLERLEAAWRHLIERHDMLRAVVLADGRQRVLPEVPTFRIPVIDLRDSTPKERERCLEHHRRRMCLQGPPVEKWPLFEMRAFRVGESHYRLHWSSSLLLCDDWTYHVLSTEWFRLYDDPGARLAPLDVSFRDYVVTMTAFESSPAWRRSFAWWRERLADMPAGPQLPLARSAAELGPPTFRRRSTRLPPDLWQQLRDRCRALGATPSAVLCTVYAEVLAAWSGERRFTLNLLFFNRLPIHEQIPRLVGNFSSTLLLPLDLREAHSFRKRARDLQRRLWQHIRHSRVSGVRVLREWARQRGSTLTAGAPVVFASNLNTDAAAESPNAVAGPPGARTIYSHLQTTQVWLDHQVFDIGGGLHVNWDAVEGLFPEGQVEAMFAAYVELVTRLAKDAAAWDQVVRGLIPWVQLERRQRVNDTAVELPHRRLEGLVADSARAAPERLAVLDGEIALSYRDLATRAAALAARLRAVGVEAERPVAVVLPKGWRQAVSTVGILSTGAPYVPVSPNLPPERFRHVLRHAGVAVAVTAPGVGSPEWPEDIERLLLDEGPTPPADSAPAEGDDTGLAYVIYTSGSTGLPKGVAIDHRGAVNTVLDVNHRFAVGRNDRTLALSSLSFDLSVYDLFGAFAAGGAIVYPGAGQEREPAHWHECMERHGVTVWNSVPALLEMLVGHCEGRGLELPPSLRLVLLSGDWIPVTLPERVRALRPGVQVVSLGGATEASIWSIFHPVDRVDPAAPSIPYGRPLANQTFHVLDEIGEPRPVHVPGELYIGGVGLARGYWRDDEKTRQAFVEHPVTGQRLYRTGDLGRWREDDEIEFLGRRDHQVKIQGYRIELGEIEVALERHAAVRQAVAVAVGPTKGPKRLMAYAVPERGARPAATELIAFLGSRLPPYMVPAHMVILESLPLSANGKVDRARLPSPEAAADRGEPLAPRDETERRLADIWQEVLGRPVGVRDDFFELGGQSLLAVRLMARVRQELGRDLPLSVLLEGATVEHLAERLSQSASGSDAAPLVAIRPAGSEADSTFFCVHPSGGNVLCYRSLATALPGDRGFTGLQSTVLAGGELPGSIEELAELYLAAVKVTQPTGPYLLGGWSMGGVVAFEMARGLAERSELAAVVLIDCLAPTSGEPPGDDELAWAFDHDLATLEGAPAVGDAADRRRLFEVFRANYRAMVRHLPGTFAGPVAVLRAEAGLGKGSADDSLGWRRHAGGMLETHTLPGDHYTLVRPPLSDRLAVLLGEVLDRQERVLRR